MDVNTILEGPHHLIPTSAGVIGLLFLLTYIFNTYHFSRSSQQLRKLPPGPKPKPIIGNLLDLPRNGSEVSPYYLKLSEEYGPVISLTVMGQTLVILNDVESTRELLGRRTSKYSGRPSSVFAGELCGYNHTLIFMQSNDDFRQMRKFVHGQIGSNMALKSWAKMIDVETRRYLVRMLERPSQFDSHIRNETTSIILRITYGYQTEPDGSDLLVKLIEGVMAEFSDAAVQGKWIVDSLPFLKHLPGWMPGFQFQRISQQYSDHRTRAQDLAFNFAKLQSEAGMSSASLVGACLAEGDSGKKFTQHQEELLKETAMSLYGGGADTTVATMEIFILAMLQNPDVLAKAQAEIDRVIGPSRLPTAEDKAQLPYCEAVVNEALRWQPVSEMVMAHVNTEDDEYNGYFIPKGSYVMSNLMASMHDPKVYSEPHKFKPERFLGPNPESDIYDIIWGYGKRICPGRFLAIANLWLMVSRTLACFNIRSVSGEEPSGEFSIGFLRAPLPYKADISVRSPEWEELIREVETTDPLPREGDGKYLERN